MFGLAMRFVVAALMLLALSIAGSATTSLRIDWGASSDPAGTGVFGYNVYRCSGVSCTPTTKIGSTTTTTYFDTTTSASTTYCYAETAFDENNNESAKNTAQCKQSLAYASHTASSNSQADVQTCVTTTASDGDLCVVPTGTVTWATPITLNTGKGVTLQCASATANACNVTCTSYCVQITNFTSGDINFFYRISQFTFNNPGAGFAMWFCTAGGCSGSLNNIRIDHNIFNLGADVVAIVCSENSSTGTCRGVVDHNTLNGTGSAQLVFQPPGFPINPPPAAPLGTANNLFIEDNTATMSSMSDAGEGCIDGWGSNDWVVRHNTSLDCLWTSHGVTHGGGPQNQEFYGNSSTFDSGATTAGFDTCERAWHMQGSGENVVFNNNCTPRSGATPSTDVNSILHYCDYTQCIDNVTLAQCDGTRNVAFTAGVTTSSGSTLTVTAVPSWFGPSGGKALLITDLTSPSAIPANTVVNSFTTTTIAMSNALNSAVSSGDLLNATFGDGGVDGNRSPTATYRGYPCWHQPGRSFETSPAGGVLHPIYGWNNTRSGSTQVGFTMEDQGGSPDYMTVHLASDRDYFLSASGPQSSTTSPFNGTTGTGWGTLANRPLTCSTANTDAADAGQGGVGYFATDKGPQGTLYQCNVTNTWRVYYQPYTQYNDGVTPSGRHPLTAIP